jgi:glutamine cyclotransferase
MRERRSTERNLFQIAEAVIRKIDPKTGEVLSTIPAPGNGEDSGLAWAEGTLWVGQHRGRRIHQVDPETGAVLRTIESDRFVTWQEEASDVRRIDPETGEVLERLEMPANTSVSGLESDRSDRFFCGGGSSGKLRAIRRPRSVGGVS